MFGDERNKCSVSVGRYALWVLVLLDGAGLVRCKQLIIEVMFRFVLANGVKMSRTC